MRYFSPGHPLAPSAFHSSLYTPLLLLFPLSYFVLGHPRSLSSLISLPLLSLHTRYLFFRELLHRRKTTHSISLSFISLHPRYASLLLSYSFSGQPHSISTFIPFVTPSLRFLFGTSFTQSTFQSVTPLSFCLLSTPTDKHRFRPLLFRELVHSREAAILKRWWLVTQLLVAVKGGITVNLYAFYRIIRFHWYCLVDIYLFISFISSGLWSIASPWFYLLMYKV